MEKTMYPPILVSAGDRGTKIIGDSVLYTCMKELRHGNSNSENYKKCV